MSKYYERTVIRHQMDPSKWSRKPEFHRLNVDAKQVHELEVRMDRAFRSAVRQGWEPPYPRVGGSTTLPFSFDVQVGMPDRFRANISHRVDGFQPRYVRGDFSHPHVRAD